MTEQTINFTKEIKCAPDKPGVYIFRDKNETVIYVGKAVNLRNRLRSYFQPSSTNEKSFDRNKVLSIQVMAKSFEYIVTETELEALILECNLIKENMPRYNVRLKDDKSYPYICLSLSEDFPKVEMARKVAKDGNKYYGPFVSTTIVYEIVELVAQKRFRQLNQYVQDSCKDVGDKNLLKFLSNIDYDDNFLRSDQFGNCMRHYGLLNKSNEVMITPDKFNLALPLCGLVESHFNMDYFEYQALLEQKLFEMYDKLNEYMGLKGMLSVTDNKLGDD
jgi:hypothetical protein